MMFGKPSLDNCCRIRTCNTRKRSEREVLFQQSGYHIAETRYSSSSDMETRKKREETIQAQKKLLITAQQCKELAIF